jgi:hypothetical protein
MEAFLQATPLSLNHIQVIVRGLYEVAQSDQVHATEQVLLQEFYNACRHDTHGLADYQDIIRADLNLASMKDILDSAELRHTFIKSCLLMSFADGRYSAEEQAKIAEFAKALDIDDASLATLKDQVTEHLLGQLAGVHNVDALCEVSKELG